MTKSQQIPIGLKFTAVVFARNEEFRLPLVLQNLEKLTNVLVVDNFSQDGTREVAEKFRRPWIQMENRGGFVETPDVMDSLWAQVRTDYLLICVCAELVPPKLLALYDEISGKASYDVVRANRISITAGLPIPIDLPPKWLGHRYPGEIRFFRRGAIDYAGNQVHGRGRVVVPEDRVLRAPYEEEFSFIQFRDYDASETERRHLEYNDIIARQKFDAGEKGSLPKTIWRALGVFMLRYFLYGGWRFGSAGLIHCYYRLHMELGIGFRLIEKVNKIDRKAIQAMHIKEKERLLETWKVEDKYFQV